VTTIHDHEADTGPQVVRALLAEQWPGHAGLPLTPVGSTGTDHAMYRLGDDLLVRMPRTPGAADSLEGELRVLPRLGGTLPVPIPSVHHVGHAGVGYPHAWAVLGWLPGTDGWSGRHAVDDPHGDDLAADVAGVVSALRAAPGPRVPRRGVGQRGGPVTGVLERIERWLVGAEGPVPTWVDVTAVRRVADASREAADDDVAYVLTHGDLIPGNVLLRGTRLAAVLDWGYVSMADPALDLVPAWALFGSRARPVFRELVGADEATWLRARANALEQALGGIVYYTPRRHPLAEVMSRTLQRVLDEVRHTGPP
jgi:aminoglycoside phosphotransferase (APT) family kinase protein